MPKRILAAALALALLLALPAAASEPEPDPRDLLRQVLVLKLNSHAAVVNAGAASIYFGERSVTAYERDGTVFLPLRFAAQKLGAEVTWDNDTMTAGVTLGETSAAVTIGAGTCLLDGAEFPLAVPAELTPSTDGNFRTMVSADLLCRILGCRAEFVPDQDMVVLLPAGVSWEGNSPLAQAVLDEAERLLLFYSAFV